MAVGGMGDSTSRNGPDLFKELFRLFPLARVEDYYRDGRWLVKHLEVDTELIAAHRVESGAPEPPPLEELELPELPLERAPPPGPPPGPGRQTFVPSSRRAPGSTSALSPAPPKDAAMAAGRASGGAPSTASSLVQQTNDFIQKWNLTGHKTKVLLLRLPMDKRKEVIANYAPVDDEADPMVEFEQYIEANFEQSVAKPTTRKVAAGTPEERLAKRQRVGEFEPSSTPFPSKSRPSTSTVPSKPRASFPPPDKAFPNANGGAKTNGTKVASESRSSLAAVTSGNHEPGDLIRSLLG